VAKRIRRFRGLFSVLLLAPLWISYLMRMFAWQSLLAGDGLVDRMLQSIHIISEPINWQDGLSITVVLGLVYGYIPYMILPLCMALDRIDQALLEASRDLGATPARTFLRVTLPLSKPAILAGTVLVMLPKFGDYYTNSLLSPSPRVSMVGNLISDSLDNGRPLQAASLALTVIQILVVPMTYYLRSSERASRESWT
jgi:spermidine/putrescine transport system permease protein